MSQPADRNLLFGVLALQLNFVGRDALVAALHAWAQDRARPLGRVLLDQGRLTAGQLAALDALLDQHLKVHGDDPRRSLDALSSAPPLAPLVASLADPTAQSTLPHSGSAGDAEPTNGRAPGAPRYRVLRPHASGGLGTISVAEDTELHREVALKEVRPEYADVPACRQRFLLEAEITGGLEHPGIVPVYGLGTYPDGRPYYAMRFIRGHSLKEAVERFHAAEQPGRDPGERSLAFRGLLRRFIDVCNAVAYAHSRGVLHRDLKPANVMLGEFGETLVVDWGLAKAGFEPRGDGASADAPTADPALRPASGSDGAGTQAGAKVGTPAFMSPEQAAGCLEEVGPAADVYGLGAMLYVVLTGRKPFDGGPEEVMAQVPEGRFTPPRTLKPDTPRALDAVCLKAMALRPADRYATPLELAAEVEHWLADEPVTAYREPWAVLAGRWARRHRTAVVAAGVFLVSAVVALSVGSGLLWREQQETKRQKGIAEENFKLARELSFNGVALVEASEAHFATPALHAPRKRFLKAASRAFGQYLEQRPGDAELQQQTAEVYRYAANVHRLTNELEAAEPLYNESLRLREGLAGRHPGEAAYRDQLAQTLRDYSQWQVKAGRLREATDTLHRAVEIAGRLRQEDPQRPAYRRTLATSLLSLAGAEYARERLDDADGSAGQAADLFRGLLELPPGERYAYDALLYASALNVAAAAERDSGRLDEARSRHEKAIGLLQPLAGSPPAGMNPADAQHLLAWCRVEQARTWAATPDRREMAETNLGVAAAQWERLATDYPTVTAYQEWQAIAYRLRGELRAEDKRADDARADFDKSRHLLEELVRAAPRVPAYRGDLGRTYAGLGRLARAAGDRPGAADWFGKAVRELRRAVEQSPDDPQDRRSLEQVQGELAR